MSRSSYDIWGGLVIAPVLVAVSLPVLAREANREGDRGLFWFLLAALLIHLGLGWFGRVVAYDIYHGAADVGQYHQNGVDLAEQFRHGDLRDQPARRFRGHQLAGRRGRIPLRDHGTDDARRFPVLRLARLLGLFLLLPRVQARGAGGPRPDLPPPALPPSLPRVLVFLHGEGLVDGLRDGDRGLRDRADPHRHMPCEDSSHSRLARRACWPCVPISRAWWAWLWPSRSCSRSPRTELRELAPIAKASSLVLVGVVAALLVVRTGSFLRSEGIANGQRADGRPHRHLRRSRVRGFGVHARDRERSTGPASRDLHGLVPTVAARRPEARWRSSPRSRRCSSCS